MYEPMTISVTVTIMDEEGDIIGRSDLPVTLFTDLAAGGDELDKAQYMKVARFLAEDAWHRIRVKT